MAGHTKKHGLTSGDDHDFSDLPAMPEVLLGGSGGASPLGVTGAALTTAAGDMPDFATIPRPLWVLFPPTGPYGKAAVIHDYLYDMRIGTRERADAIFLEAMGVLGVPWLVRRLLYAAVRVFGGKGWRT